VRTKDSCWFVATIYDLSEMPGVSTTGPGIGRGVTLKHSFKSDKYPLHEIKEVIIALLATSLAYEE
jgi:hypothetical protein